MLIHARLVKRGFRQSSSGHVYKDEDVNRTLCGGPMTEWDITVREIKNFIDSNQWRLCPECKKAAADKIFGAPEGERNIRDAAKECDSIALETWVKNGGKL